MRRFTAKKVRSGLVTAWRLAGWPTRRSPSSVTATIEGVVRMPSEFSMTLAFLPSITATHEFVVPRSIPMTFPMVLISLFLRQAGWAQKAPEPKPPKIKHSRYCDGWGSYRRGGGARKDRTQVSAVKTLGFGRTYPGCTALAGEELLTGPAIGRHRLPHSAPPCCGKSKPAKRRAAGRARHRAASRDKRGRLATIERPQCEPIRVPMKLIRPLA